MISERCIQYNAKRNWGKLVYCSALKSFFSLSHPLLEKLKGDYLYPFSIKK